MVSLTFIRNLLCLTLFAVALPTALSERCYPAYIYRFRGEYRYKNLTTTVDCSFKKCKTVCQRVCDSVPKKVPYKVCKIVKVPQGEACKYAKVFDKKLWVSKKVCKTKFTYKRICNTLFRIVQKEQCKKRCYKDCQIVLATCVKIKVYRFQVQRANISCGSRPTPGYNPDTKIGRGSLHKVIDGKRTIHHCKYKPSMFYWC